MLRRSLTFVSFCLSANLLIPVGAGAVEIDPGLQAQLANKAGGELVPVVMIWRGANEVAPAALAKLGTADPQSRRSAVLTTLQDKARITRRAAQAVLDDPARAGKVRNVRHLYLANAMSFEASAAAVAALAALPDEATLLFDRTFKLTGATRPGVTRATPDKGTAANDTVWSIPYVGADRVWNELGYTGNGVLVGHIDTGVSLTHPDLMGRLWVNPGEIAGNGLDDDNNGFSDDINGWDFGAADNDPNDDSPTGGHGTHTAGTVVGDGTGGTVTGTAPGAKLMALKVWQDNGTGGSLGMIWAAQQYAVENGARIITMSLGIPGAIPVAFMQAERFNDNNIRDAGVTLFNSAGNDHFIYNPPEELGVTARVPAPWNALPVPHSSTGGVITVGGTGYLNDSLYGATSRGPAKWDNVEPWHDWPYNPGPGLIKPDICAPGVGINSTVLGGGYSGNTWQGTSMACPQVAAVAALMLEKNPTLSPAGIDSLLELTAVDLGTAGKDVSYGSGRIDAWAAVNAVPGEFYPDLTWTGVLPDPAGDGVLDPGTATEIAISLQNIGLFMPATNVTAEVAVVANPYVTVVDGFGSFANLMPDETQDNTGDPFRLDVAPDAPQGYEFTLLVTVTANTNYQVTFDIPWYVGLPDWLTHDKGGMFLSVTDQGIIGYMAQDQSEGIGMGYQDGGNGLFLGSFWAGTDASYICNRDYGGLGSENFEWVVAGPDPNGRMRDLGDNGADQTYSAIFTDGGHANPKPLQIKQTSLAYGFPENDHFVILEYEMTNLGPTDLPALYNGVYCDFDILPDAGANRGGTDPARNLSYLYAEGGYYMGVALLGPSGSAQNQTVVNNPVYVYPTSAVDDGNKMRLLRGLISESDGSAPDDWSVLTSSVVSLAADGGQARVAYALVVGETLAEIQLAVDEANELYNPVANVGSDAPALTMQLGRNTPNPFNPFTEIQYTVPRDGAVELAIYDVSGRRVRTLVKGTATAGERSVRWDGRDETGQRVPSGLYFTKYRTAGETRTRKMTLLK